VTRTVTLYSRAGCHLCDEAEALLRALEASLGFELETVDIESDTALDNAYRWTVPVVSADGVEVMRAPIRADRLESALRDAFALH
jgi:glutaredoxin